ncbi:MAG: F0F1 ATP synthase subunit A, partial [Firmicutes bacterium]|nr:F0F1 ATP synthase subunit A [Bacillota bacterium]
MEHHASYLATLLTNWFHLARHAWGDFAHGQPLSVLERYDHLFAAVLAALVIVFLAVATRAVLTRIPGPFQQSMEFLLGAVRGMASDNIHHHPDRYVPLIGTLGLFILLNNLFG